MADNNIQRALVTSPTFINGVLHMPGEIAVVDLDTLGIKQLGDGEVTVTDPSGIPMLDKDGNERKVTRNLTPGLAPVKDGEGDRVVEVPVAAVAPHAPGAPNAQGIPPGTVQSGTGRLMAPTGPDEAAHTLVGADKPLPADNNDKPTKSGK